MDSVYLLSFGVFALGYMINMFYISVLYHRALTHNAVILTPFAMKLIAHTGKWVTGVDPKGWACMHRLHHEYSDTEKDPHSPVQQGVLGVAFHQVNSYNLILEKLMQKDEKMTVVVKDIPFDVHYLNRSNFWVVPFLVHILLAVMIAMFAGHWLIGVAYYVGITSHPVQGWLVNALSHRYGYRNFDTNDHSTNNLFVAYAAFGEGFQNNHHAKPMSANFAAKKTEFDFGYVLCKMAISIGLLRTTSTSA